MYLFIHAFVSFVQYVIQVASSQSSKLAACERISNPLSRSPSPDSMIQSTWPYLPAQSKPGGHLRNCSFRSNMICSFLPLPLALPSLSILLIPYSLAHHPSDFHSHSYSHSQPNQIPSKCHRRPKPGKPADC